MTGWLIFWLLMVAALIFCGIVAVWLAIEEACADDLTDHWETTPRDPGPTETAKHIALWEQEIER